MIEKRKKKEKKKKKRKRSNKSNKTKKGGKSNKSTSMTGISNEAIEDFFEKVNDEDITNNFIGVFPSNFINRFISYHSIIKDRSKVKYPFIIMNTDRSDRVGTHWWSFLDLHPKKEILLFDSFGFEGLKKFIIDNDKKALNKVLYNFDKSQKNDRKITLISLKFSMKQYEKIKDLKQFKTTTQDLLHLMYEFGKLHGVEDEVTVYSVDDQLQKLESDTCGVFQIYFYYNLFKPLANSSIIKDVVISRRTIENLINEIFSLNQQQNEQVIQSFATQNNIR